MSVTQARGDRQPYWIAAYLLLVSTLFRFPYFFADTIDWDESTFILMGQSLLDGHLPYTNLWDLKPPLAFLFYAFSIAVLGKSIISVRIAGLLSVVLVAFLIYWAGKHLWNPLTGIVAATLSVVLSSLLPSGQAVMTEHVALVPLVGAFSLLVTQKITPRNLFFAGILMAIASLVRLNLAYVAVMVGCFAILVRPLQLALVLQRGIAYTAGNLLIIGITFLPYALTGQPQVWWSSVVLAPLNYAHSQHTIWSAFQEQVSTIWASIAALNAPSPLNALIWIGGLMGVAIVGAQWRNLPGIRQRGFILLIVFLIGIEFSILRGGAAHGHYLIQLAPFMALATAACLNPLLHSKLRGLTAVLVVLVLATSVRSVASEYSKVTSRALAGEALANGPAYEVAEYLVEENSANASVYLMTDHIAYWLIDAEPLSKASTHPSNITKEYLLEVISGPSASAEAEMARILAQNPKFIVKAEEVSYLVNQNTAKAMLQSTLQTEYELVEEIESRRIYRRRSS